MGGGVARGKFSYHFMINLSIRTPPRGSFRLRGVLEHLRRSRAWPSLPFESASETIINSTNEFIEILAKLDFHQMLFSERKTAETSPLKFEETFEVL
jgi:hypothetical protein